MGFICYNNRVLSGFTLQTKTGLHLGIVFFGRFGYGKRYVAYLFI